MQQITVRLPDDILSEVDDMADNRGVSRSECLRDMLDTQVHGSGMEEQYEQSQREVERLQTEVERLKNEKQTILAQREENRELRKYVADDKSWHEASILTRVKWYLRGKE